MASVFGHSLVAATLGYSFLGKLRSKRLILAGIICSTIPDADVIAFKFGIPYEHMFGHRGISHSIFFAVILAYFLQHLWYKKQVKERIKIFVYLFICTVSHGLIDTMTTGGKGIALLAPFNAERMFAPWRMIKVSPIHWQDFFGSWGISVLKSEAYWIGIPCVVLLVLHLIWTYTNKPEINTK